MKTDFQHIAQTYFRGTITAEDEVRLSAFLKESEENRLLFKQWSDEWRQVAKQQASSSTQAAWAKMLHTTQQQSSIQPLRRTRTWLYSGVATALLLIGCALWLFIAQETPSLYAIETGAKEQKTIVLPDGTEVILNSASVVNYTSNFNQQNRQITFQGEALFNVATNTELPFVVQVGDYNVTVLGTQFNLSAYPQDGQYTLSLLRGSVKIKYLQDSIVVVPNQQVRLDIQEQTFTVQACQAEQASAWLSHRIEGNMSLYDLSCKLERLYNIDIVLEDDTLANENVYISMSTEDAFDDVRMALETLLPITIEQEDNLYYIRPQ